MDRILQSRYRIVRSLGRGGRGAVFLCDDLRLPGRQWAIKQMQTDDVEDLEQFRAMFRREAATLSALRHPNLPLVVDTFEDGDDAYLVMEYVDGENLAQFVHRCGPMPELMAFEHGLILAEILEYLHEHDPPIIFRDLKPDNVMRTAGGEVKLIDFGLARRFVVGKSTDTLPAGSVGYAAPEQWDEQSQSDERSDIYAWGATIVHLLTARIPSPQFPLAAFKGHEQEVSEAGMQLLRRCLMQRPAERLASAGELVRALREQLELGAPVSGEHRLQSAALPEYLGAGQHGAYVDVGTPTIEVSQLASSLAARPPRSVAWRAGAAALGVVLLGWVALRTGQRDPSVASTDRQAGVAPFRHRFDRNPLREQAQEAYRAAKWPEAIDLLDRACTQYPDDAEAHILSENAYIRMGGQPFQRVPYIGTLTGVDGPEAYSHLYGVALGQSTVNARGGIHGRKVLVDYLDDASSTARCLQIAEKFLADPSALLVLGPTTSQRTLALAPLFNAAKVSLVASTASASKVWTSGPYVFSAADAREPRVRYLARYITRASAPRIVVLYAATMRLSVEMADVFADEATRHGATCLQAPTYAEEATSLAEQVAYVKAQRPDVVFIADYRGAPVARVCVALRQARVSATLCSQVVPYARTLVDIGGKEVDGLLTTEYFHPEINTPHMRAFVAAFRRKFGDITPTYAAANSFDTFLAAASALERCQTRKQVQAYLKSTGTSRPPFDGVGGPFALGKRLDARPIHLIEVRGGRFLLLDDPEPPRDAGGGIRR